MLSYLAFRKRSETSYRAIFTRTTPLVLLAYRGHVSRSALRPIRCSISNTIALASNSSPCDLMKPRRDFDPSSHGSSIRCSSIRTRSGLSGRPLQHHWIEGHSQRYLRGFDTARHHRNCERTPERSLRRVCSDCSRLNSEYGEVWQDRRYPKLNRYFLETSRRWL